MRSHDTEAARCTSSNNSSGTVHRGLRRLRLPLLQKWRCCCFCWQMPRKLDSENLLILSLIQLLCGSAAVILFGVALTKRGFLHEAGTGLWSGCLMLAAGCVGVAASRQQRLYDHHCRRYAAALRHWAPSGEHTEQDQSLLQQRPQQHPIISQPPQLQQHSQQQHSQSGVSASSSTKARAVLCSLVSLLVMCVLAGVASTLLAALSTAGLVRDGLPSTTASSNLGVHIHHISHSEPHHRMHLIVLHTLLFIVGFLECSVSIATCIICARQICFGAVYLPPSSALLSSSRRNRYPWPPTHNDHHTAGASSMDPLVGLGSLLPRHAHRASSRSQSASQLMMLATGQGRTPPTRLPVLAANPYFANVLFPQHQQQHQPDQDPPGPNDLNYRASLVYLLSSPTEPSNNSSSNSTFIFPPFPPCYSPAESRPLCAYACLNSADNSAAASSDLTSPSFMQPALLLEEDPPPYSAAARARQSAPPLSSPPDMADPVIIKTD